MTPGIIDLQLGAPAARPARARDLRTTVVFHLADVTGPAKSLRPRLEALARRGVALELLAPGEGSLARAYGDLGPVRALPYASLTVPRTLREGARALRSFARDVGLFRRELRLRRPDVVVVVTTVLPAALIAARLERLPTVVYVGEIFPVRDTGGTARALGGRAIARLSAALADRLVCCSKTVAGQFERHGRTVTIYPGISRVYAEGDGAGFRARHGLGQASPLVAVVGNVTEGRGQDTAVRALAVLRERFPEAHLVIVGLPHPRPVDEAFGAAVRALVRELGVEGSVTFTGFVERVPDVYAAADVVANPARLNEAFGRVAFEALMAGRPVVASAVGAIPEVLRDGCDALLVAPDDPGALAEAVSRLVENPALRDRLVAEGRRRVESEFGEEVGIEAFERVVADVLEKRSDGPRRRSSSPG
ncbi:MAG TPA: glycosyltransferase family 4 protein [Thermoleophilaceae bacterium]|nr:glycosyltransferase family 4 protein [Thermoleophilaceae bacterium]